MKVEGRYGKVRYSNFAIMEVENGFLVELYYVPQFEERTYAFESLDNLIAWMRDNLKTNEEIRKQRCAQL